MIQKFLFTVNLGFAIALAVSIAAPAYAEVPLAGPEAEQRANQAVPAQGKALLYVYQARGDNATATTLSLNGKTVALLEPGTFGFWNIEAGHHQLRADGESLTLNGKAGRVYFVELTRTSAGGVRLRRVPYAVGRTQTYQARLVGAPSVEKRSTARSKSESRLASATRTTVAMGVKWGSYKLSNASQTILGSARQFDDSADSLYAIEGEWFFYDDVSFGVEYLHYANSFTTDATGTKGKVTTVAVFGNLKYYLLPKGSWRPYVCGGIGGVTTDSSGAVSGRSGGIAVQVLGGVQWRLRGFDLRAEYKLVQADTKYTNDEKVDVSGNGLFIGVGFHF